MTSTDSSSKVPLTPPVKPESGGYVPAVLLTKDLSHQTWIVTGANTGIGLICATQLAKQGATVILGCRNAQRAQSAIEAIRQSHPMAKVQFIELDLADTDIIRRFVQEFKRNYQSLHGLMNNAGVMACPLSRTKQGFEMQVGSNHLGHFLLTNLLLDTLERTATAANPVRVITVSSLAHLSGSINTNDLNYNKRWYFEWPAYGQSKLANLLFAKELAKRTKGKHIISMSLHPGVVRTELLRHHVIMEWFMNSFFKWFSIDAWRGAQTSLWCALSDTVTNETVNGAYYDINKPGIPALRSWNPQANNDKLASDLWELSKKLVNV